MFTRQVTGTRQAAIWNPAWITDAACVGSIGEIREGHPQIERGSGPENRRSFNLRTFELHAFGVADQELSGYEGRILIVVVFSVERGVLPRTRPLLMDARAPISKWSIDSSPNSRAESGACRIRY